MHRFYMKSSLCFIVEVVLLAVFVSSCSSTGLTHGRDNAIMEEVAGKIRQMLKDKGRETFRIEVTDRHNGTYYLISDIFKSNDSLKMSTRTIDMQGLESDTVLLLSKGVFMERVTYHTQNNIALAGHHQTISVSDSSDNYIFHTRFGIGLVALLKSGSPSRAEIQRTQLERNN